MSSRTVNAAEVIDSSPVGAFQIGIFVICALVAAMDGLDTQAIGYTAPLIALAIHAKMAVFGTIFSAGLVGATVGALALGPLADRFGRKWLLFAACLLFSAFTLATIWVHSLNELLALRFLAGLGLGGAAPSFLAMGAEYAPRRLRSITVAALYSAFPLGAAIGGFVGAYTIPHFGWRSMFVIGGVGPLLIAALIAVWLPESLRFLVAKGVRKDTIKRILSKIAPKGDFADAEIVGGELVIPQAKSKLASVFQDGRAPTTLILWVPFFTGFMVILTVTTWTPSLLKAASVPISMGVLILAANNLGGVVGAVVGGHLLKKYGPHLVLAPAMIVGGVSLAVFGQVTHSIPLLMITSIVNGLLVGGSISMLLSLAAAVYPTMIRSTGIGWAMGVGRFGQILGPIALGLLVARHIPISGLFMAMAIPCVIGGLAILGLIPLLGRLDFGAASAPTIDEIATGAPEI